MYRIMYKEKGNNEAKCLGNSTDLEQAIEEMEKMENGPLANKGMFYILREGSGKKCKKEKRCEECKAVCSGAGKEGNGNQCSFHTTEEEEVFKW